MFRKLILFLSVFLFPLSFGNKLSGPSTNNIINHGLPKCRNCKYFAPHDSEIHKYSLATCLLYGQKDIISGKTRFEFAQHVRNRDGQCSREGLNYEPIGERTAPKKLNTPDHYRIRHHHIRQ